MQVDGTYRIPSVHYVKETDKNRQVSERENKNLVWKYFLVT